MLTAQPRFRWRKTKFTIPPAFNFIQRKAKIIKIDCRGFSKALAESGDESAWLATSSSGSAPYCPERD